MNYNLYHSTIVRKVDGKGNNSSSSFSIQVQNTRRNQAAILRKMFVEVTDGSGHLRRPRAAD